MTACQRIGRVGLLLLVFCLAVCGVAGADPGDVWDGTVDYRNQWGQTVGTLTVTVSTDGAVSGMGSGEWDSIGLLEVMDFEVTGTRHPDSFDLSIHAYGKGDDWRLNVTAPIVANAAEAVVNGNAPSGTYPQARVRLACQNCGAQG